MVLEKFGIAFRNAMKKIASAVFVDKALIDSILKDMKRSLLEADVDYDMVQKIGERIRQSAIEEKSSLEKKEHMIKLIHDEMTALLGRKKYELPLNKKPTKVMFLGLYGTGKCVHGKSQIQLGNGNIAPIKEIYRNYSEKLPEEEIKDGKIIDLSDENLVVPSFNPKTLKIENKKVTHLWKLNKAELVEIKLDNGNDFGIKVTPEHPFFVLRNGQVTKIRADEITENEFIAIPSETEIQNKLVNLFEQIKELDLFVYMDPEEAKRHILSKNRILKEACKKLKFKKNYCGFTSDVKRGEIPIEFIDKEHINFLKIKGYKDKNAITLPMFLTPEFAEFIGHVMGDGNISKNYIQISNQDTEVISRIKELSKLLFGISPIIKKDKRTKKMLKVLINSGTLIDVLKIFGLKPGKKGKKLSIPEQILLSNNDVTRLFIRAYFDCDSYPSKDRYIELTSESQILIQQMSLLLRRFSILSAISKKFVDGVPYWRLYLKARYAEAYADKIGYIIKEKQNKVNDYKNIGLIQGSGNQDMIPLGKALRTLRLWLGFSIGEIQKNAVNSYGIYEEKGIISKEQLKKLVEYYKYKKKGIFLEFLKDISMNNLSKYSHNFINGFITHLKNESLIVQKNNQMSLSQNGGLYLKTIKENENNSLVFLEMLDALSASKICWLPVREINHIANDENEVYDLTVEDNHSFIADGFIVHNTTTIAKLAFYYAKRGFKVCMLGLDVHRPAAPEQLEQLAEQANVPVFINKEEKNPFKIWKQFENDVRKFDIVLIDTAGRDAVDLSLLDEIKELQKAIKPEQVILALSADIGQTAKKQVTEFKKACNVNGVIITRMDSSAKGGGALIACSETSSPVLFITTGEKLPDIEAFNPTSFVSRLLGMGDLEALLEKAKTAMSEGQEKARKNIEEGRFTLNEFYVQIESMQKMGPLSRITELIPGLSGVPEEMLAGQEEKLKKWRFAINSMTKKEIEEPDIIDSQRIARISKGSHVSAADIREMLNQHKLLKGFIKKGKEMDLGSISGPADIKKLSQTFSQKQLRKLAKKYRGKVPF